MPSLLAIAFEFAERAQAVPEVIIRIEFINETEGRPDA